MNIVNTESRNSDHLGFFWHLLEYIHIPPWLAELVASTHLSISSSSIITMRGFRHIMAGQLGLWPGIQGAGLVANEMQMSPYLYRDRYTNKCQYHFYNVYLPKQQM